MDADVILTNPDTLMDLTRKDLPMSAPLLRSDGMYSNFWCGMTDEFYYKRTEDYKPILDRERMGCFKVPMVHSAVLVNIRYHLSPNLTFFGSKIPDYGGPTDDIITFALSAKLLGKFIFLTLLWNPLCVSFVYRGSYVYLQWRSVWLLYITFGGKSASCFRWGSSCELKVGSNWYAFTFNFIPCATLYCCIAITFDHI